MKTRKQLLIATLACLSLTAYAAPEADSFATDMKKDDKYVTELISYNSYLDLHNNVTIFRDPYVRDGSGFRYLLSDRDSAKGFCRVAGFQKSKIQQDFEVYSGRGNVPVASLEREGYLKQIFNLRKVKVITILKCFN